MGHRANVAKLFNSLFVPAGFHLYPEAELSWQMRRSFTFNGLELPYFFHSHNCGWPPHRCTERVVELALADFWLRHVEPSNVWEIGAVTPYYWPRRVEHIVDPFDSHTLVTHAKSVLDCDMTGLNVLSISTLEHIGTGEYGLPTDESAQTALLTILDSSAACLVTFPIGYNTELDEILSCERDAHNDVSTYFLVRCGLNEWKQELNPKNAVRQYGPKWATAICVIEKGSIFLSSRTQLSTFPNEESCTVASFV